MFALVFTAANTALLAYRIAIENREPGWATRISRSR
jgi:hypothetical protein